MPFFGLVLNSAIPSCHFSLYARFLLRASPAAAVLSASILLERGVVLEASTLAAAAAAAVDVAEEETASVAALARLPALGCLQFMLG